MARPGLYSRYIVPRVINCLCAIPEIAAERAKVVPQAEGVVLEVGIGSGLNMAHYDRAKVQRVIGVDPGVEICALGRARFAGAGMPVELIHASGEDLPLDDRCVDTVLLTYTLCSIPDAFAAATEMRRVLRPGGRLLLCEHGRSKDVGVARWQNRINPLWRRLAGGCNVNRDAAAILEGAGFRFEQLENFYLPGAPKFAGFHYRGVARPF
ncbi:MAG TPA: class I SAM-dependent methyltransferase [Sphingomonadaceae bacterium]|nr:class I SAM-dependent methyltransferase [Sphingomonadaceae bacterium]